MKLKRINIRISSLLMSVVALVSCTSVYQGRTLGKGKMAVETTLGGPILTDLGAPIPVPNLFTGLRYGLRNDLDIAAQYNILGPILPGIALDLITSATWIPVQPGLGRQSGTPDKGWGAGGVLDIQWVTNFKKGLLVLPSIDLVGSYRVRWISMYIGSAVGANFYRIEPDDGKLSLSPFAGFELISSKHLSFGVKCTAFDVLYNYNGSQAHWVYFHEDKEKRKKYAPFGISIGFGYEMKKRVAQ